MLNSAGCSAPTRSCLAEIDGRWSVSSVVISEPDEFTADLNRKIGSAGGWFTDAVPDQAHSCGSVRVALGWAFRESIKAGRERRSR